MKRSLLLIVTHLSASITCFGTSAYALAKSSAEDRNKPAIKLSAVALPAVARGGLRVEELSALAWDADEQLLYAVSDKGKIFHFRLKIKRNKISSADAVYGALLRIAEKTNSQDGALDTEGITLLNANNGRLGDSELVIVNEKKPGYFHFNPKGSFLRQTPVPALLEDPLRYQGSNKGLESAAHHAEYGFLTAPELPLKGAPSHVHTIYANQRQWSFSRYSIDARLKAITVLEDGNLMVLERKKIRASKSYVASLRYVNFQGCEQGKLCRTVTMAVLPKRPDNFEGLTQLGKQAFLIVSDQSVRDNNGGKLVLVTLRPSPS